MSAVVIAAGLLVQVVLALCAARREHLGKKGRFAAVEGVIFFVVGLVVLMGAYTRSDLVLLGAEVGAMVIFVRTLYRHFSGGGSGTW